MGIKVDIKRKLGEFSLDIHFQTESKRIGILGASGCGKSMTLKSIAGIEIPDSGMIQIDDKVLFDSANKVNLKPQKRNVGYLFQNYALFPTMTVAKNIAAGLKGSKEENQKKVQEMIEKFALTGLADRLPGQLSGGQQQRVALARIMAYEPDVILLDEPFSALDVFLKDRLQQELIEMLNDYEGTVIMVSHSRDEIYRFSEELLIMDQGKPVIYGETKEIFAKPVYKEAAKLTGCKNFSRIKRVDVHTAEILDWGITLHTNQEIDEQATWFGYRAHDFVPVWDEISDVGKRNQEKANDNLNDNLNDNRIPVEIESVAKLPFEHRFFLRISGKRREENAETEARENVCWFVQRDQWKMLEERGLPAWLYLPEEKILLLK